VTKDPGAKESRTRPVSPARVADEVVLRCRWNGSDQTPSVGRADFLAREKQLRLEGSVHPFMPAVLLGLSGLDQLGSDSEANPPDGEL
jgi:hypothetical protein